MKYRMVHLLLIVSIRTGMKSAVIKLLGFWRVVFLTFTARCVGRDAGDDVVARGRVTVGDAGEVAVSATEIRVGFKFLEFRLNVSARTDVATSTGCDRNFGSEVLQ